MTAALPGWPGTRPLTTEPWAPPLAIDNTVGQLTSTVTFQVVDVYGQNMGTVTPVRPGAAIQHDTSRTIKRQLQVALGVADMEAINPINERILPTMTIGGESWPLGRYVFTDDQAYRTTRGRLGNITLFDEMWIVDQKLTSAFSSSAAVPAAVVEVCRGLPIPGIQVDASPFEAAGAWAPGAYRGAEVLSALATQGDYETPWMANSGYMRMIRTVRERTAIPAFDFDTARRVIRSRIVESTNLLTAPNRWTVIANSGNADTEPITATFDVPASAPHSLANRGFVIAEVLSLQLNNAAQARDIASGLAARAALVARVEVETAPDPRHDSYDVIRWQGENWVETAWTLPLDAGATMTHTLRRSFQ